MFPYLIQRDSRLLLTLALRFGNILKNMTKKSKEVVVSGMRPTGRLHLGHFFGVLKNWQELQKKYSCYFFVADWHSLTTEYAKTEIIQNSITTIVIDWLAAGINPDQAILFVQSQVPEHAELHLLLSMITPLGWLERVPSYKELKQENKTKDLSTYGFLGYPLLQTSDVAIYKARHIPVGQDQVAHIELAREIIRRFSHLYSTDILPEPKALLTQGAKILGTDGRKMSKSYDNCVYLSDSVEEANKKFMAYITDPQRKLRGDPGNPDVCPIYAFHQLVTPAAQIEEINRGCRSAAMGCVDCKKTLLTHLNSSLEEFRNKRKELEKNPKIVYDILKEGSLKASAVARETLKEVRSAMGMGEYASK